MERKILVAVDSSVYSRNEIHYLERLFEGLDDISFHFIRIISVSSLPPGSEWVDELSRMSMLSPEARKKFAAATQYMKDVVSQFVRRGVSAERITTSVRVSRVGVADDLVYEARKGMYDALLVGRRGIGKISEMVMGSVSGSMLEKCFDIPLWVVDGQVNSRKFFVPVDGTLHCLRAVDHLSYILQDNPHAEITLFHSEALMAHKDTDPVDVFHEQWGKEWCDEHIEHPDAIFHAPEQILLENGFPSERISRLEKKMGVDPARDIINLAVKLDEGTIVMGRRGRNDPKGFMGGVSDRVMRSAEKVAVWLVS